MSDLKQTIYLRQSSGFGPWVECEKSHPDAVAFDRRTQPEATAPAQDLSAAILALPEAAPAEIAKKGIFAYYWESGFREARANAAALASSANALSAGDRMDARNKALDDAAARVEDEVCGCCWPEDVQEFASHVAETIRAIKEDSKNG